MRLVQNISHRVAIHYALMAAAPVRISDKAIDGSYKDASDNGGPHHRLTSRASIPFIDPLADERKSS